MKGKIYLIENQDDKMLGLFMFLKIIVCKDDDFSAFRSTKFMNENFVKCTRMYTSSMQNGIDCCNNQPSSLFCFNLNGIELLHLTYCLREMHNF